MSITPIEFLSEIFPELRADEQIYVWSKHPHRRGLLDTAEAVAEFAKDVSLAGSDLYYGVGIRVRGSYEDISRVTAVWADLDAKDYGGSQDAALQALNLVPVDASFIVNSGHGYHAYWLLKQSINPRRSQEVCRVLQHLMDSGAVSDPTRVLRIPGTINYKDPDAPMPVGVVAAKPLRRYLAEDLYHLTSASTRVREIIATGSSKGFKSRSERDWAVAQELKAAGISDEFLHCIAEDRPVGDRWRESDFRLLQVDLDNTRQGFAHTVRTFQETAGGTFYASQKGLQNIATFCFNPTKLLQGGAEEDEDAFLGTITAYNKEWLDIIFPRSAFTTHSALQKFLVSAYWQWFASDHQTREYLVYLMKKLIDIGMPSSIGTTVVGRHDDYWVTKSQTLSVDRIFTLEDAPVVYVTGRAQRTSHIDVTPAPVYRSLPDDDYAQLMQSVSRYLPYVNEPSAILPMLGWFMAAPLKPLILACGYRFPHLNIFGTLGSGKLLANSEPVLTPQGWVENGSLQVGDFVIGQDGHQTEVLGVYPQGKQQIVRVTFSDGTWVRCSWNHLWTVQTPDDTHYRPDRWIIKTTEELVESGLYTKEGQRKWKIPIVEPVVYAPVTLPLDPYLLGVLLGDEGPTNAHARIATEEEIVDALEDTLHNLGLAKVPSWEKRVPEVFLRGTPTERLSLLQGLMDTDGYASPRGGAEFSSSSQNLIDAVIELTQSLGGIAHGRCITASTYKGRQAERVSIKLPPKLNPFRLSRKRDAYREATKYLPTRSIVSVKEEGFEEATCIRVAAHDSLYVTRSFIVTHNTAILTRVLMPLLGISDVATQTANTTEFVLRKMLSSSNAVPVIFGEYRASTAVTVQNDFYTILRMAYDVGMDSRGRKDLTTVTYSLSAPIIVDGEDPLDDPALKQRSIIVNLHPDVIAAGTNANEAFQRLVEYDLAGFGTRYIQRTLKESQESITTRMFHALDTTLQMFPSFLPDRVRNSLAIVLLGLDLFNEHCYAWKVRTIDYASGQFSGILGNVMLRLENGTQRILVDDFIEDVVSLVANPTTGQVPFLCVYDQQKNVLWMHLRSAATWWTKERRHQGRDTLEIHSLQVQLNEKAAVLENPYVLREDLVTMRNGETLPCFGVDLGVAAAAGLSVPNILASPKITVHDGNSSTTVSSRGGIFRE